MSMEPYFTFKEAIISNHLTQKQYTVRRMVDIDASDVFLQSIVDVCNETAIYDWLFRQRLQGAPYPYEDAVGIVGGPELTFGTLDEVIGGFPFIAVEPE